MHLVSITGALGLVGSLVVVVGSGTSSDPTPDVERRVERIADSAGPGWSHKEDLPVAAEMVALTWDRASVAGFTLRGQLADGSWTELVHVDGDPSESPDGNERTPASGGPVPGYAGPAWLGHDIRRVEVRLEHGSVHGLELHAIDTETLAQEGVAAAAGLPVQPGIISRAQWGADESWRSHNPDCGEPRYAENATYAVVHHTATTNSYSPQDSAAMIRGIYEFHVFGNGWCDIAYNFLIDRFGQTFEGRFGGIKEPVIGGHTGGFNTRSIGVAVLGDFTTSTVPSSTYSSLRGLLAFKLGHHGIDPQSSTRVWTVSHPSSRYPAGQLITIPTLLVHGDLSQTSCPGGYLREVIPRLRADVAGDIARAPFDPRLVGDWDNDGKDTVGTYAAGVWSLRDSNTAGPPTRVFSYGWDGAVPVVGDWDGDGRDGIGVYADGWWLLRNTPSPGPPEIAFNYGYRGAMPVVGSWNGAARDSIGLYDSGWWLLRNSPTSGFPEIAFSYGWRGPTPVVGDWDGDGRDGIGVWNEGAWHLRETATGGAPQRSLVHGGPFDRATTGNWDGLPGDGLGLLRGAYWYQRNAVAASVDWIFWF